MMSMTLMLMAVMMMMAASGVASGSRWLVDVIRDRLISARRYGQVMVSGGGHSSVCKHTLAYIYSGQDRARN